MTVFLTAEQVAKVAELAAMNSRTEEVAVRALRAKGIDLRLLDKDRRTILSVVITADGEAS